MFSQATIENLGYYVYFLKDPRNNEVFYVGKGVGNRLFNHLECALETVNESEKLERIRDIQASGQSVKHFILRHGLNEKDAFEVEAALIDFIGMSNLSNMQGGHYSNDYGLKTAEEISAMYEAKNFQTELPVMLININKLYDREMTSDELYQATRQSWVVGERRNNVKYGIATYRGLTREVYKIDGWYHVPEHGANRWGFSGELAEEAIRQKLIYKSITDYFKKGAANPIKYVNC
ncbi:MAG: hypothetical protein HWE16_04710 [Gammaproteobacteria bacterium]|nr:hypothetical protein [Gammaproteobacteria bacterium]